MRHTASTPPRFAIAASAFLYDTDLPDHLYRTYARITGLAWQQRPGAKGRYARTPPLTVRELAAMCGMSERTVWRQLDELTRRGLLDCETVQARPKRMVFSPVWPGGASQAAPPAGGTPRADGEPAAAKSRGGEPPGGSPPGENGPALAEFGVDLQQPRARQVAALPHVTPALVRAWGTSLQQRPGIQNLPGLLLHVLQQATDPPPPAPSPPPAQAALPEPLPAPAGAAGPLPGDLRQALEALGLSGDGAWAEVAGIASRDGRGLDFVWAWVRYVQAHPHLGPGFLRSRLRGTTWPARAQDPEAQQRTPDRARWRAQWPAPAALDPPPSPREEAMARYGIAPETMALWDTAQRELALQMDPATFEARLQGSLLLAVADGRATLGVPRACSVDWVQHRLDGVILRALARHVDGPLAALDVVVLDQAAGGGSMTTDPHDSRIPGAR